jgi:hypothetical protein
VIRRTTSAFKKNTRDYVTARFAVYSPSIRRIGGAFNTRNTHSCSSE